MDAGICQPPASGVTPSMADKAPAVLQRYFKQFPNTFLTQHHMESYEAFIFRELPEIIQSETPITILKEPIEGTDLYRYKTEIFVGGEVDNADDLVLDVAPPTISLDGMFPSEARIRDLTYAATFQADIFIKVTFTMENEAGAQPKYISKPKTITYNKFPLFRIPILIRSRLCATYGANKALLQEMGECRHEQGGYFIIDGSEKLLITRQERLIPYMLPQSQMTINSQHLRP
jgi:DNA-directed RNA polymerase II subunit RPB2